MKKENFAFILSTMLLFAGYIAVQNYYISKQTPQQSHTNQPIQAPSAAMPATASAEKPATLTTPAAPIAPLPQNQKPEDLKLDLPFANLAFTEKGGCLGTNAFIKERVAYNDPTPVSVVDNDNACKAFGLMLNGQDLRTEPAAFVKPNANTIQIIQRTASIQISKTLSFDKDPYFGNFTVHVQNISQNPVQANLAMEIGASSENKHSGGLFSMHPTLFHAAAIRLEDGTIKRELTPFESSPDSKTLLQENNVFPSWVTADSLYWMNTLVPQFKSPMDFQLVRTGYNLRKNSQSEIDETVYEAWLKQSINLNPGQSQDFQYKIYMGPKDENILKKYDDVYHLEETIDYGFFKIVARPLYFILNFLHSLVHNWGVAIILLTILINLVFMPLQIKGYASAQKMQALQPQIKALQEKYKEDKQTLHKETMELMSKNGANPLSGCLPLLPQIPVFFGLNSTLQHTFDLRQSPFYFWIHDLTRPDPYFILPVIMAALMIGYQKMMPMPTMEPAQAKMMKFLPIIFSVLMLFYPTGLALYVITNTIVSMVRQSLLTRHFKK